MTSPRPYFFLSYAHSDDRVNAGEFFKDLSEAVCARAALPADTAIGFIDDEDVSVGTPWRLKVGEAIATCVCFVPLVSPNYLRSEECGREYQAFLTRMDFYERLSPDRMRPEMLLPVQWTPCPELPSEIAELGVTPNPLGETYRRGGLGPMMNHYKAYQQEYNRILVYLADEIVKRTVRYQMLPPADPPDLKRVISRFHRNNNRISKSEKALHVYFVVASAGRVSLMNVRRNGEFYGGDTHLHWMPYHPRLPDPIGEYSYFIAKTGGFDSGLAGINELDELVTWAQERLQIVVVIVDTWATRLASHRDILERYDRAKVPATAVMVPFSASDSETRSSSSELRSTLRTVFLKRYHDRDLFRSELETHEEFSSQLLQVLRNAHNQLMRRRRPPEGRRPPPPGLLGP